jgi:hypothetical protein
MLGVIIKEGPQDWEIIQQENGIGEIKLAGEYYFPLDSVEHKIYARIVREENGDIVIPWTECQIYSENKWSILFNNIPVGGLYRIETGISHANENWHIEWAARGDIIHHVGVGDIYLIAGQSNAVGFAKDPIYDPPEIGIHVLKNSGRWDLASHPLNDSTNTIHEENMDRVNPGHAPYLSFAKMLKRDLGIPIGLIPSALNSSPLRRWNPHEEGDLYRNAINTVKLTGGRIRGILWYQGCSDAIDGTCDTYMERFENMVSHFREDLNDKKLPVFTVQINRNTEPSNYLLDQSWGKIREAQRNASKTIENVYVVPAIDLGLSDHIHNSSADNIRLGERIAKAVLTEVYEKNYLWKAPDLKRAELNEKNKICLYFKNVPNRLFMFNLDAKEIPFTILDEKGEIGIEKYILKEANVIELTLQREFVGNVMIHGVHRQNPVGHSPIDIMTHLPMLSFYGANVELY